VKNRRVNHGITPSFFLLIESKLSEVEVVKKKRRSEVLVYLDGQKQEVLTTNDQKLTFRSVLLKRKKKRGFLPI